MEYKDQPPRGGRSWYADSLSNNAGERQQPDSRVISTPSFGLRSEKTRHGLSAAQRASPALWGPNRGSFPWTSVWRRQRDVPLEGAPFQCENRFDFRQLFGMQASQPVQLFSRFLNAFLLAFSPVTHTSSLTYFL